MGGKSKPAAESHQSHRMLIKNSIRISMTDRLHNKVRVLVAENFDLKQDVAEEALFFEGIPVSNKNNVLSVLQKELRKLTEAIEKVFLYWHVDCRKEKECRVRQVTLVGLGASVPGLAQYLENSLQIETRTPEPFAGLALENEVPEMTESESLRFLPALAVALRGFRK